MQRKILVVDDDLSFLEALSFILKRDFQVSIATGVAEAARECKMYRHKIHYSLDRGDGIENDALYRSATSEEIILEKTVQEKLYVAIMALPEKQAKRLYAHFYLGMSKAGNMGSEEHKEMLFWTKEEYKKFSFEMMDKPVSFYAFEMPYWSGIREGELLALIAADFDFEKETVRINKSYQRLHGKDVITTPKTKKSNRTIKMPKFLCEEMQEYFSMLYGLKKKDRVFTVTKSYLHHEMDRGAKAAGVKRIRIHDLRYSHISLLIDMGFSSGVIVEFYKKNEKSEKIQGIICGRMPLGNLPLVK